MAGDAAQQTSECTLAFWGLVAKNMAIWGLIGQVLAVKCAGFRGLRGEIISESDANGVRGGQ
ncbi:MAG: hypothetical protein DWG81_02435 [Chloroflexi bacterium]|nr:hypothetical protein [Chloroflexota bacterium]